MKIDQVSKKSASAHASKDVRRVPLLLGDRISSEARAKLLALKKELA